MNKKIIRVISFVMALTLAFGVMAFAAEDEKKSAVLSFESVEAVAGEIVSIQVKLNTTDALNSIALRDLKYDKELLKFVGFTSHDEIDELALFKTWDDSMKVFLIGLEDSVKFDSENEKLCKIEFVALKAGEATVSAELIAKNGAEEFATVVNQGTVSATGDVVLPPEEQDEVEAPELSVEEREKDSILLKINTNLAMAFGEMVEIDNTNASVVPYIVNGRTLVPLRFVSETLGAEVEWEEGWNYCFVKKNGKAIKITFNSADIEVDGEIITYDAPIQVVENRTMVPIRFISETLGYDVYWNEPNQIVAISPVDNPWVKERAAELSTINSMMVTLLLKRKL